MTAKKIALYDDLIDKYENPSGMPAVQRSFFIWDVHFRASRRIG